MVACTYNCLMNVINIGNSIIGVSILAMPYCFSKCGILLSIILILLSGLLTKRACFFLLKSAVMAHRRSFEFLAFHTLGPIGKLIVEMSVIGFLIGVCIAFFVVIGDLGPPLFAEVLNIEKTSNLRTNVLVLVGLGVALPLGLLRKIDSLTKFSALSIAFYVCLILKIFAEAVPHLAENEWWYAVNWWRSEGFLPCLPIFSMALSCQTQLFEFFDTMNESSLKRMQSVIDGAVYLCSFVYILVGFFGYVAFHDKMITGNILLLLTPSYITEFIKFGFILTVAVSFPLCLFPCRSSLHSLLFKQGFVHHEINVNIIPDHRFRILTVSLIVVTIGIAVMLPDIEFVLGLIGSTIGTIICIIVPALIFISDSNGMTSERRKAQILLIVGIFILVACTISTFHEHGSRPEVVINQTPSITKASPASLLIFNSVAPEIVSSQKTILKEIPVKIKEKLELPDPNLSNDQKRLEPPVPQEPDIKVEQTGGIDPQALKKEDKELQKESAPNSAGSLKKEDGLVKQEELLKKMEEQHEEQKLILEEQKKVLQELKQHKESHELIVKQEAEKKKEEDSEKLIELHNEQKQVLIESEKILKELKQQKELIENQSPVAVERKDDKKSPAPNLDESVKISQNVVKPPLKENEVKNLDIKLEKKPEVAVVVTNISGIAVPKEKISKLEGNTQDIIKKIDNTIQENNENAKIKLNMLTQQEKIKALNETFLEIKSKIQSLNVNASKTLPQISEIPLSLTKESVKPNNVEIVDAGMLLKRRETLENKVDFEVPLSLPKKDANLNPVIQKNTDGA